MIQRDFIERLIQQAVQGLAEAIGLIRRGQLDPAMVIIEKTTDLVLGSLRPAFERLDATSAAGLVAEWELDRVRLYAALLGEQGAVHELRGNQALADQVFRRALEFYEAAGQAGVKMRPADLERLADLKARLRA